MRVLTTKFLASYRTTSLDIDRLLISRQCVKRCGVIQKGKGKKI